MTPLVTIGIPTYDRPELLARTLAAVADQDYESLEVLVADNASPGNEATRVVERYRSAIPGIAYTRHEKSLGPIGNFMFLLGRAKGGYFMWLADDDEMSPDYVSSLVDMLEADSGAASAAGHWFLMHNENEGRLMATSSYPQRSALARVLRFIWGSDDAFFYALHRTDILRQANFRGYWWPNRAVPKNWAYVFLIDVLLRGRVLIAQDTSVRFINHNYTAKSYASEGMSLAKVLAHVSRRINVHYLYWEKCARLLNPLFMPLVIGTSGLSLIREACAVVLRRDIGAH